MHRLVVPPRLAALPRRLVGRAKKARALWHYLQFVRPGDLCFDIGARTGQKTRLFRSLGARVLAVEPHPASFEELAGAFQEDPDVVTKQIAVGQKKGRLELWLDAAHPETSTASRDFVDAFPSHERRSVEVDCCTLDDLIVEFGVPSFCKIDTEGLDLQVLRGLSRPLRSLSFEYLAPLRTLALDSLAQLETLGSAGYNISLYERHRLEHREWLDHAAFAAYLRQLPASVETGDVYVRFNGIVRPHRAV